MKRQKSLVFYQAGSAVLLSPLFYFTTSVPAKPNESLFNFEQGQRAKSLVFYQAAQHFGLPCPNSNIKSKVNFKRNIYIYIIIYIRYNHRDNYRVNSRVSTLYLNCRAYIYLYTLPVYKIILLIILIKNYLTGLDR